MAARSRCRSPDAAATAKLIPVRARIGDTVWETSLFPKDGGYVVPVKDAVRVAEGIADGDIVTVRSQPAAESFGHLALRREALAAVRGLR